MMGEMEVQVQDVNENDYVNVLEVADKYEIEECVCSKCGVTYFRINGSKRPKTVCKKCWYGNLSKKGKKMEYTVCNGIATFTTSQGIEFTVDEEDAERVAEHTWYFDGGRYIKTHIKGKVVYLHRFVMGSLDSDSHKGLVVDHKLSIDKLNNCKSNLRWCTVQDNARNRKDCKGYSKSPNGSFEVEIGVNRKGVYLGRFKDESHANAVRIMKEKEFFGEFSPNVHLFNDPNIQRSYDEAMEILRLRHENKYRIEDEVVYVTALCGDETTKEFVIDLADYDKVKNHRWYIDNERYVIATINGEQKRLSRYLMGFPKGDKIKQVRFIDGDRLNLRRNNLKVKDNDSNE